mmetsp:Transcript_15945/g.38075  ORF Transcript_15945/g.38075 Transcript_15945/m.38075 type:complete len:273 (+) Transcript_15945:113-931(+)
MSYPPYDSGELMPSGAADTSVNADPSSSEREADAFSLPPLDKLPELLRALVERHGRHAFMKALLRVMSKEEMMETTERLCNAQWGEEPLVESDNGAVGRWESAPSPARSTTSSVGTALIDRTPARGPAGQPSIFKFSKCWLCEPAFGESDEVCEAIRALGSLEADVEEYDAEVQNAEETGDDARFARRAARYHLYRKWVHLVHNRLGKRVRVRIPPCVVEFIRDRYREPGCTCSVGGPLYGTVGGGGDCVGRHGYTGHREAQAADEDEEVFT